MTIYKYCQNCKKIVSLRNRDLYSRYNHITSKQEAWFICSRCNRHAESKMPEAISRDEFKALFRYFQIIKDHSERNQSTLYPIYWHIFKDSDWITTYGTDDEICFFYVRR